MFSGIYQEKRITCAPLLIKYALGAEQQYNFIIKSLLLYGRTILDVACIVGVNCSVNQKRDDLCGLSLVGCSYQKFNIAVQACIKEQYRLPEAMKSIRELMNQLRAVKKSARLRELTHLCALSPSETRCTGNFDMIQRFSVSKSS